jgi:hypothetical protein
LKQRKNSQSQNGEKLKMESEYYQGSINSLNDRATTDRIIEPLEEDEIMVAESQLYDE